MATMPPCSPHMVGARDIVEYPEALSGWLRRRGKLERQLYPVVLKLLKLKWRQRFVVIANGFLYVFKDETSSRPVHASSLAEYHAVLRGIHDPEVSMVPWCFKLEPVSSNKTHYFACTCQKDMENWMGRFKRQMMKAHNMPVKSSENFDSGDYTFLEASLMPGPSERTMSAPSRGPAFQSDNSSDYNTDDLDEEYFEIDQGKPESRGARSMPLPEIPKSSHGPHEKNTSKQKNPKQMNGPNARSPISHNPRGVKEAKQELLGDFLFDSSDKEAAARLRKDPYLDKKAINLSVLEKARKPGIFLVRQSRKSANQEVLAVSTAGGVKEYQIFNVGNKKTLDKALKFDTVEQLVQFYKSNNLPTQPLTLSRSYSSLDLSAD